MGQCTPFVLRNHLLLRNEPARIRPRASDGVPEAPHGSAGSTRAAAEAPPAGTTPAPRPAGGGRRHRRRAMPPAGCAGTSAPDGFAARPRAGSRRRADRREGRRDPRTCGSPRGRRYPVRARRTGRTRAAAAQGRRTRLAIRVRVRSLGPRGMRSPPPGAADRRVWASGTVPIHGPRRSRTCMTDRDSRAADGPASGVAEPHIERRRASVGAMDRRRSRPARARDRYQGPTRDARRASRRPARARASAGCRRPPRPGAEGPVRQRPPH